MSVSEALAARVVLRAGGRCEYCRMSQWLQGARFHVDHVVPLSRGGTSVEGNLALACPGCNLHKADRIAAVDPVSAGETPLFNPRQGRWEDHFVWDGWRVAGRTRQGRATVAALAMNHPRRILIRQAEAQFGLFPSDGLG